jgi:hypothetical protein
VAVPSRPSVSDESKLSPPVAHPEALVSGPQTEKLTVPVGVTPVTVAVSLTELPSVIAVADGADFVLLAV